MSDLVVPVSPTPADAQIFRWHCKLRYIVTILQFSSLIPALYLGFVDQNNIASYIAVMSTVPLMNLLMKYLEKHRLTQVGYPLLVAIGVYFDLIQLSILLTMTGGWSNPFSNMVFLYACLASLSMNHRHCIIFALVLICDIIFLHFLRSPIPTVIPESQPFAETIVALVVGASLMLIVNSLSKTLIEQHDSVTRLKKLSLKMNRLRAIGALSSGVCHQLATPLNNVRLCLDRLIRDQGENEVISRDLASMDKSLSKAVSALRNLAHIQVEPNEAWLQPTDLNELLHSTCNTWKKSLSTSCFDVVFEEEEHFTLFLPVSPITQVFLDLLDNAAQASPQEIHSTIIVKIGYCEHGPYFSIQDQGTGFPEEVLSRLGEPFNTMKEGGSGLGLYHAKLITEFLGGLLIVRNVSPGAEVVVVLGEKLTRPS